MARLSAGFMLAVGWLLLGAAQVVACVTEGGRPAGVAMPTFILIGGGLEDDNEAVYRHLLIRHDTDKIVIVPYASGEPDKAAANAIAAMKQYRPGARYVVLPDPAKDAASLARAAEWIGHADLVYFTGGDQSRLVPRFKTPEGRDNAVMQALRDGMLRWGTVVGGTSAGAAVMADPMFTGGGSEEALGAAEPGDKDEAAGGDSERRRGPRLGLGFGLVGGVVIDTHTGARGRVGRMVAALEKSGMRWGLGLNENGAVVVRGGQWTAIGDEAAFVLDAKDLRRDATGWHGVRLGVLSDGDRVELPVNPGENVEYLPGNKAEEMALEKGPGTAPGGQSVEHEGAWKAGVLMKGLMSLSARPSASVLLRGKAFDVSLRADADTQFGVQRGSPAVRAWGVVLGIFPHVEGEKKVDGEGEGTGR